MELLNLDDLEFTVLNYKESGEGLRKWFLASLEYHPKSIREIAKLAFINYMVLLNFIKKKSKYMSYINMVKLRDYVKSLMVIYQQDEDVPKKINKTAFNFSKDLKKEDFFEG